ncbi:MAG: O-antigen ligase family protein [Aestuariibacter sp.]|nr:O-antigen ligase family protein [Aestuariibacter sp.]
MTVFKLLKNTPLVGLLLLIIAYVLSPLFHYQLGPGGFNDQRFLLLLFGAVCLLSTVLIPRYRHYFFSFLLQFHPQVSFILLFFFIATMVSSVNAAYTLRALQEVGLYATLMIAVICLTYELKQLGEERLRYLLVVSLGAFLVIYALHFAIYYGSIYGADPTRFSDNNRWMPNFYNRRSFNQTQVWLLPAFFWLCWQMSGRSKALRITCYGLTALWWVMLFFSHGRGIGLALLASTLGVALLFQTRSLPLLKPAIITLIAGVVLYGLMFLVPPYWLDGEFNDTYLHRVASMHSGGRIPLWEAALDIFLQYPLFGGGPQHYSFYQGRSGHAHNMLLNYLAELGLLGTIPIVLLITHGLSSMIKNTLKRCSEMNLMLVYCFLAAAVYSQFTAQLYFPVAQMLLILFVALALNENLHKNCQQASSTNPLQTTTATRSIQSMVCALALVCLLVSSYDVVNHPYFLYQVAHQNHPRFWLNGNFHRYPHRVLLPNVVNCKVNERAPDFSCH